MSIYINGSVISSAFLGGVEAAKIYIGTDQIFPVGSPVFNPEANLSAPSATNSPGGFDWTPPATGFEKIVVAFDLTLPSPAPTSGLIFEQGGGGRGAIVLVRQGYMRFRFGDGGADIGVGQQGFVGTSAGSTAKYVWDVAVGDLPFDGTQHTIVWEIDPLPGSSPNIGHRMWCDGILYFDDKSSNQVEANSWSGSASGGFLNGGTNMPGEKSYSGNWPIQSGQARLYLNQSVT